MHKKPNMLFIMSDQHSKFHLGCYGDQLVRTPHLDRLASEGMTFTNAYTAAPLCVPARMAFMTGRRPSANQVWTNDHILRSARTSGTDLNIGLSASTAPTIPVRPKRVGRY